MLYIICEDSGSGLQFWQCVADLYNLFMGNPETAEVTDWAEVITAGGEGNIANVIDGMRLENSDRALIAIDMVGTYNNMRSIKNIRKRLTRLGITYEFTGYYCVEELFLSFRKLKSILGGRKYSKYIQPIQKFISVDYNIRNLRQDTEEYQKYVDMQSEALPYFVSDYEVSSGSAQENEISHRIKKMYLSDRHKEAENREQAASYILEKISSEHLKGFRITKRNLGPCWFKDCKDSELDRKTLESMCKNTGCNVYEHTKLCMTGAYKLTEFWSNIITYEDTRDIITYLYNIGRARNDKYILRQ